jgi:glycosyltransferase involved in cell wall biosynthesis
MTPTVPLVSIGLPVRNGENSLRRALDSLLSQEYRRLEVIISDNASTDETGNICQDYARADNRLRYFRNETNIGAASNFKRVLELATGQYFMWAAHDDKWHPDFVKLLVGELETHSEANVAMSATDLVEEDGSLKRRVRYLDAENPNRMSYFAMAAVLAAGKPYHFYIYGLYRASFLKCAFISLPNVAGGDRLFICELALATRFRYVDAPLYIRTVHNQLRAERYTGDQLQQHWQDRFASLKHVAAMGPHLAGSRLVPLRRKFFVPVLVLLSLQRFASRYLRRPRPVDWVAERVPESIRRKVRRWLKRDSQVKT